MSRGLGDVYKRQVLVGTILASCQLWVALKFSIAHLLPVAWTARLVRSAGPSRRLGMVARASIIPQSGQMSVALSLRERAGGSV